MFERLDNVCWLKGESFGRSATAVGAGLQRTRRHLMQGLKRERFAEWQDGQGCKSDVRVLLHLGESKWWSSSVDDVRILLHQKKIQRRSASATRASGSQRVARQWVAKKIAEQVLHSCCNAASECLRARAFFPSATQTFQSATLRDCNTKKIWWSIAESNVSTRRNGDEGVQACCNAFAQSSGTAQDVRLFSRGEWRVALLTFGCLACDACCLKEESFGG